MNKAIGTKLQRVPVETLKKLDQAFPKEKTTTGKLRKLNKILDEWLFGIK